ncbi:threonylcarbamoyl-AMP synthase [Boudabousia tangfeifanii]|uniref:L-threonylcarbamoyladenylate synthase n=1 Tax=Boudabousia tangfeifanii TaxID=1912795 RepID=A0A1D9MJY7_9ACTO|nr:L-threonylcarbamoyladenylate synthase [Boudabousia tangfeifanii]AOZ72499.1 threonylcarbamoyl-AMP synthase [Boudabousia tangfeifanii]
MNELLYLRTPLTDTQRERIAQIVKSGGLIVVPTDTIYGIGANALDPAAVDRLRAAKGRGRQMPPPVVVDSLESALPLVASSSPILEKLAKDFWPGALSIIVRDNPEAKLDLGDLKGTVALRVPQDDELLELLRITGPLALTSANTTASEPSISCFQAQKYFGSKVSAYVDGGLSPCGIASTMVDITDDHPRIVREGAIPVERVRKSLSEIGVALH